MTTRNPTERKRRRKRKKAPTGIGKKRKSTRI